MQADRIICKLQWLPNATLPPDLGKMKDQQSYEPALQIAKPPRLELIRRLRIKMVSLILEQMQMFSSIIISYAACARAVSMRKNEQSMWPQCYLAQKKNAELLIKQGQSTKYMNSKAAVNIRCTCLPVRWMGQTEFLSRWSTQWTSSDACQCRHVKTKGTTHDFSKPISDWQSPRMLFSACDMIR